MMNAEIARVRTLEAKIYSKVISEIEHCINYAISEGRFNCIVNVNREDYNIDVIKDYILSYGYNVEIEYFNDQYIVKISW